jgi:hypothetical protein
MPKGLSKAKAAKMLHEGVANGRKITDKQRKYFAVVAAGKARKGKAARGGRH